MCFPPEAVPPPVPASLLVGDAYPDARDIDLTSSDGTVFSATYSVPTEARGAAAVLVLPDVRGLFDYYRNLTRAFAAAGYPAIAIDYFGRTAGTGTRGADFDWMPHLRQTDPTHVQADLASAQDHLAQLCGASSFVTVGFCFGGTQSYLATTHAGLGLAGAVAFYGGLDETRLGVFPHPAGEAAKMSGRLLALYGGADPGIPDELRLEFDQALTQAGVEHEFVVYPGAPHSFFDRAHDDYSQECADSWARTLKFLSESH